MRTRREAVAWVALGLGGGCTHPFLTPQASDNLLGFVCAEGIRTAGQCWLVNARCSSYQGFLANPMEKTFPKKQI